MSFGLPTSLFSTPQMDAVFTLASQLKEMTRFEWALSAALEAHGVAEPGAASALEALIDADFIDAEALLAQAREAGNLAIPFVRQLTVEVRKRDEAAARFVHFGATSQDVLDTALVLQMRDALGIVRADLDRLNASLARRAEEHAGTILAGRTWLQAGPPVTLGLKIAGWLAALRRHRARIDAAASRALVLQFGGAVGTLAVLGEKGPAVSNMLARALDLVEPDLPWHTHRDNLVEAASCLGLLVGTLGKIARDVSLLMQSEIGEVAEPAAEGRGRSSTMPHKRNPVASAATLAVAARVPGLVATLMHAMVQEHERGLGGWQAEWETLPEIFRLTAHALGRTIEIAAGLEIDAARMKANLDATRGLVLGEAVSAALAEQIGRAQAHEVLERAAHRANDEQKHLREILLEMPEVREHLSEADIDRLLDPRNYLGSAQRMIERVVGGVFGGVRAAR